MNLRSINAGFNIRREKNAAVIRKAAVLISEVKDAFKSRYPYVRTTRFCSQPLIDVNALKPSEVGALVKEIDGLCRKEGINWFCMPIGTCKNDRDYGFISTLPAIMSSSEISFSSVTVTQNKRIDFKAANECARQIKEISKTNRKGFDNFRFCVSANTKPNGAFFPYSWHKGENGFSLGLETIDVIIKNAGKQNKLSETRQRILKDLSKEFLDIDRIARRIEAKTGLRYYGLDLSLAPYPTDQHSIGRALQKLGVDSFGASGTLFLTAYLTNMLKQLEKDLPVRTVGFTGVMYPVLEDRYLTESNDRGLLSMESMLLYSTVCGCGPDMIPLPGDVSEKEIASVILDMSTLALILDKPLIARLVPIPGKKGGEKTDFHYPFFHNTRIMDARGLSLTGRLLQRNQDFEFL